MDRSAHRSRKSRPLLGVIVVIILIAIVAGVGWLIWKLVSSVSVQVAAALITGAITALVATGTLFASKALDRRKDVEQELRRQKVPIYEEFMAFWISALTAKQTGRSAPSTEEVGRHLSDMAQKVIIWGPDDVVRKYTDFLEQMRRPDADPTQHVMLFEELLYVLRADIGHKNKRLGRGDLLAVFVNDVRASFAQPIDSRTSKP